MAKIQVKGGDASIDSTYAPNTQKLYDAFDRLAYSLGESDLGSWEKLNGKHLKSDYKATEITKHRIESNGLVLNGKFKFTKKLPAPIRGECASIFDECALIDLNPLKIKGKIKSISLDTNISNVTPYKALDQEKYSITKLKKIRIEDILKKVSDVNNPIGIEDITGTSKKHLIQIESPGFMFHGGGSAFSKKTKVEYKFVERMTDSILLANYKILCSDADDIINVKGLTPGKSRVKLENFDIDNDSIGIDVKYNVNSYGINGADPDKENHYHGSFVSAQPADLTEANII